MLPLQVDPALRDCPILVVDDQEANVRLLERMLIEVGGFTRVRGTTDPRDVFLALVDFQPDLIMLDLVMPELDGFSVLEQLRMILPPEEYLPVLVLTADVTLEAKQRALGAGAMDFLTKPFDAVEVLLRARNLLESRRLHTRLEARVRERTREIEEAQVEILERLARAGEYRDDMTGRHAQRVRLTSEAIARALDVPDDEVELIGRAALLHDLGKIGIPDAVLLKPGALDPDELETVRQHPLIGARLLENGRSRLVQMAEAVARTHHEHWDGSGYPAGLKGEEIPLAGRIVAAADVFDGLVHARPYKSAWTVPETVGELRSCAGTQFDPAVVAALEQVVAAGEAAIDV